jgi:ABC-2 type transport system permease protein
MRAMLVLAKLRALDLVRTPSSIAFFFLLPIALLAVLGVVFANGHPFEQRTVVVVGDATLPVREGTYFLRADTLEEAHARLSSRMASAIAIQGDDGWQVIAGEREAMFAEGLVSSLREERGARVRIEALPRWGYVHFLFPGLLCFAVLTAGMFGMGHTMVRYRQSLFLKKLATTPLPKWAFVAAQILSRSLLVMAQVAVLAAAAWAVFDVPLGIARFFLVLGVSLIGLLAFMGMGFALACAIESEALMVDAISALNIPLVFASEMFFPLDALPGPLPAIAGALPTTLMVRAVRDILVRDAVDPVAIAGLLAWAIGTFALSLSLFRWHR